MSAKSRFESQLTANLQCEMFGTDPQPAAQISTGAFDAIIQALIDAALDILMNCTAKSKPEDVAGRLASPGAFERAAIRKAVRDNPTTRKNRNECSNALIETLKATSPEDCKELVAETKEAEGWLI